MSTEDLTDKYPGLAEQVKEQAAREKKPAKRVTKDQRLDILKIMAQRKKSFIHVLEEVFPYEYMEMSMGGISGLDFYQAAAVISAFDEPKSAEQAEGVVYDPRPYSYNHDSFINTGSTRMAVSHGRQMGKTAATEKMLDTPITDGQAEQIYDYIDKNGMNLKQLIRRFFGDDPAIPHIKGVMELDYMQASFLIMKINNEKGRAEKLVKKLSRAPRESVDEQQIMLHELMQRKKMSFETLLEKTFPAGSPARSVQHVEDLNFFQADMIIKTFFGFNKAPMGGLRPTAKKAFEKADSMVKQSTFTPDMKVAEKAEQGTYTPNYKKAEKASNQATKRQIEAIDHYMNVTGESIEQIASKVFGPESDEAGSIFEPGDLFSAEADMLINGYILKPGTLPVHIRQEVQNILYADRVGGGRPVHVRRMAVTGQRNAIQEFLDATGRSFNHVLASFFGMDHSIRKRAKSPANLSYSEAEELIHGYMLPHADANTTMRMTKWLDRYRSKVKKAKAVEEEDDFIPIF